MKIKFMALLLSVVTLQVAAFAQESASTTSGAEYVEGELLVRFRDATVPQTSTATQFGEDETRSASTTATTRTSAVAVDAEENPHRNTHARVGATLIDRLPSAGYEHVRLSQGLSTAEGLARYRAMPEVLAVQPNYIYHVAAVTPDDPLFSSQYGPPQVKAPDAWTTTTGSSNVVVAVLDTGVDYNHEDLQANMWRNPGESVGGKETDGIDNDQNGYVDDVFGIDAVDYAANPQAPSDPMDEGTSTTANPPRTIWHGTYVAGILGAQGYNNKGIAGINWQVKIMALRFNNTTGQGTSAFAARCLDYAVMMKTRYGVNVRVANHSYVGRDTPGREISYNTDNLLSEAMTRAGNAGILNVVAAGNASSEVTSDPKSPFYPAGFNLPSMITLAATDKNDVFAADFSNYSATMVHLAAPGVAPYSTVKTGTGSLPYPNNSNDESLYKGTSYAAPHVSGAAALLLSINPSLTVQQMKAAILGGVDPLPSLQGKVSTGGRLNIAKAFTKIDTTTPSAAFTSPTGTFATSLACAGTASDGTAVSASGVASVDIRLYRFDTMQYWDGTAWVVDPAPAERPSIGAVYNATARTWSCTSNLPTGTNLPEIRYRIRALVTDYAGNLNAPYVDVVVDKTPPTMAFTSPAAGGSLASIANISGTASDIGPANIGTIDRVSRVYITLRRYNSQAANWNDAWNGIDWVDSPSYALPLDASLSATGATATSQNFNWSMSGSKPLFVSGKLYRIRAVVTDVAGNTFGIGPRDFSGTSSP